MIVAAVLLVIVGSAVIYIKKEKKRGVTCIGCPHAGACAKRRQGGCDHHAESSEKEQMRLKEGDSCVENLPLFLLFYIEVCYNGKSASINLGGFYNGTDGEK